MSQKISINIGLIKTSEKKAQNNLLTQLPSPMLSARRRKSKIIARKNNEELIEEAYQQLLSYVDSVDNRVQDIIQTHQGQFLEAYKQHVKRLREEMQDIKRKSLNNSNSEKVYLQKIDILEKQLVIFRDESLKLFQKIINKDKEIDNLQRKIIILEKDNKEQEKSLYNLAKTKKQLEVEVQKLKNKIQQFGPQKPSHEFSLDQKRNSQILTPLVKNLFGDFNEPRPYTTNIKSQRNKNHSLRLQSSYKAQSKEFQELNALKKRLLQKVGDQKVIEIQTVLNLLGENKVNDIASKRGSSHDYRSVRNKFVVKMDAKRNKFLQTADRMEKLSKQMRQDNELKVVFKNCVEQIRKDIVKRNNIPSLNFFKENGPKSYIQFKKIDYYSLLQLLIKNERVSKSLYELIFGQKPNIQI